MSLNDAYKEHMTKKLKALEEAGEFTAATNHVNFDATKLEHPEGVTNESLHTHVNYINELSVLTEAATANIAHAQYENNNKITTVDGTLSFGDSGFVINSQHHLKQQVGEEWLYGQSTTAVDYTHSEDETLWLSELRESLQEKAAKLFAE